VQKKIYKKYEKAENNLTRLIDLYYYTTYNKNKNHKKEKFFMDHLDCKKCKRIETPNGYFTFPVNHYLKELVKKKKYETCFYYDPKDSCQDMEKYHLKCMIFITKFIPNKVLTWYRHFLSSKYHKEKGYNHIDELFYRTHVNIFNDEIMITRDAFMNDKLKKKNFFSKYQQLDREIRTKTTLYGLSKSDYHELNCRKVDKVKETIEKWLMSNNTFKEKTKEEISIFQSDLAEQIRRKKIKLREDNSHKYKKKILALIKSSGLYTKKDFKKKDLTTAEILILQEKELNLNILEEKVDHIQAIINMRKEERESRYEPENYFTDSEDDSDEYF